MRWLHMQMPMPILFHALRKRFVSFLPPFDGERLFLLYDYLLIITVLAVVRRYLGESFGKLFTDVINQVNSFYYKNCSFVISSQELRDIAATKEIKGKHFFLETDIRGPGLKLDNSGKAILTVSIYNLITYCECYDVEARACVVQMILFNSSH
jgi:hypothetical protein